MGFLSANQNGIMMSFVSTLFKDFVMKRTTIIAVCTMLLFGGLLCLHLAAQPVKVKDVSIPLLDPKIKDSGERELLEMKVESYRKIAEYVDAQAALGTPRGRASFLAEAYANLAAAEIELYRFTGDRDKLLVAMDAKVEALTNKLRGAKAAYEYATTTQKELCEAEIQLLDALLERKRMEK
jgi:hypothetical protein